MEKTSALDALGTSSAPDVLPVILGGDIGAYSLARAFNEAYGTRSLVLSQSRTHLIGGSSILENRVVERLESEPVFLAALAAVAEEHAPAPLMLLACGDWYVRLIAEHRDELAASYAIPYVPLELLDRLTQKDRFLSLCAEAGVPCPRTAVYDPADPAGLDGLPLTFPLVAKAASSADYHYAQFPGKRKVFFLDDRAALDEALGALRASGTGRALGERPRVFRGIGRIRLHKIHILAEVFLAHTVRRAEISLPVRRVRVREMRV